MSKIFNSQRKANLKSNNIKQYLKYALGEIILVVIGILIAVGLNNWNIYRLEKKQEVAILLQLNLEYKANLEEIDQKILMRNMMMESAEKIIYYADNGFDDVSLDTLSFHLSRTHYDPTFDAANGVTTELINSGKLYLLRSEILKSHLTSFSREVGKLNEQEVLTATYIYRNHIPYLQGNFDERATIPFKNDGIMDKLYAKGTTRRFTVKKNLKREAFDEILNDSAYQNQVIMIGRMTNASNRQSIDLRGKIVEIIELTEN